ncbi:sugar ABC transporter ATP-binding protein [Psychromonas sp. KJ10-10]|uniref:sugar ABC transporter ATP-binding protein n=1 Tax=Psychromonas sp. KJ10-10 TaxID=3391823 RepID=UPI0039B67679
MNNIVNEEILRLENINKAFSGVQVLHNINVSIHRGEVLGLLGENGAGKSTLLKIISGLHEATSGNVYLDNKQINIKKPSDAKKYGIAMIPQEFNLVSSLNVFENVFLGQELKKGRLLDKNSMRQRTQALLNQLETHLDPDSLIETLSVAEKQMVEIAKALVNQASILIMDEPTTVLTNQEVGVLFELIAKLKAQGVTIIFISHKLKEVKLLCDRLMILRDGHLVSIEPVINLDEEDMASKMVGRELNQIFPEHSQVSKDIALQVEQLNIDNLIENIEFKVHRGEVLGFAGLIGSGRTEMAEAVMGLRKKSSGKIKVFDQEVIINTVKDAVDHGLAYLSEDRQGSGLIMNFNLPENISLISLKKYIKGFIQHKQTRQTAEQYSQQFAIKAPSLDSELQFLSGGNQQKVYLAKWMDTQPDILILDEPTRGVDINTKKDIYHFIHTLTEQGKAVIIISSEMEELIGLAHRVLVIREGKIAGQLSGADIEEQKIMFLRRWR